MGTEAPSPEDTEPNLYIYELYVTKEFRGLGLGTHLVKIIEEIGRANPEKFCKIMLTAFKPLKNN